jgi:hypothetical protein
MGDRREVDVDVILNPDNVSLPNEPDRPDGYNLPFKLESNDMTVGPNNLLTFDNKHSGGYYDGFLINFRLKDPYKTGYVFPEDEDEALWVEKAGADGNIPCPDKKSKWGMFKPNEVKGEKLLIVRNYNHKDHQGKFGYTLRVTLNRHANPMKFAHLDPPGDNTNGHGFISVKTAIAATLTVGGVAAVAVYFGLQSENVISDDPSLRSLVSLAVGFGIATLLFRLLPDR